MARLTMKTWYDAEEDIYNVQLREGEYWKSIELPSGLVIDLAKDGGILAPEIQLANTIFTGDVNRVIDAATQQAADAP